MLLDSWFLNQIIIKIIIFADAVIRRRRNLEWNTSPTMNATQFLLRTQNFWGRGSKSIATADSDTQQTLVTVGAKLLLMTTDDRNHGLIGDFCRTCKDEGAVNRKTHSAPFLVREFNTFLLCIFHSYLLFFFKCRLDLGWIINICFPQYKTFYTQYFWLILSRKLPSILERSRVFHSSL